MPIAACFFFAIIKFFLSVYIALSACCSRLFKSLGDLTQQLPVAMEKGKLVFFTENITQQVKFFIKIGFCQIIGNNNKLITADAEKFVGLKRLKTLATVVIRILSPW